jgi:probable phosphoglycerate mutase
MLLHLIRHGESVYNREGRIQGQADIELSEFGLRQAAAIPLGMQSVQLDAIFSSPLKRAYQSAVPLAQAQNLEIQIHQGLKEINVGVFSGLKWPEVAEQFPEHAEPWEKQDMDFVIPGGESRQMLQDRGVQAITEIAALPYDRVAIVAHGGLLCAALKGILRLPRELNPFSLFNASISRLIWDGRWQVLTLNQTEHLVQAGVAKESGRGNL